MKNRLILKSVVKRAQKRLSATKKARKKAKKNDPDSVPALTALVQAYKKVLKKECRRCWRHENEDFDSCETSDGGGGGGGGDGSGNPTIAQSCTVINDPPGTDLFSFSEYSTRIANGATCSNASGSPVVALTSSGSAFCSGTLIAPNKVLSAAHCLVGGAPPNFKVELQDGTAINVASSVQNPAWPGGNSNEGDSSVITLESSFIGVNIPTVCWDADIQVGDVVVMAGYGISEVNSTGTLKATTNLVEEIDSTRIETFYLVGNDFEGSTCVGDSGGPLFAYVNEEWCLVGDLSTGGPSDCAVGGAATFDNSQWTNLTEGTHQTFVEANL